ncbi:hypothetical protein [Culicoidibacter larvae]|uniref:DUF3021 domain-containing protein n=1 Tax=Culicoidibacter larvae TaxID=2579976 RepID=A0A5R8QA55_9FIRM|nr:hypothetical protein [Culicoidibacter larvae]TLG72471.1 hypothetical protein FEZ08_08765 [Culicoidibacter larvae]
MKRVLNLVGDTKMLWGVLFAAMVFLYMLAALIFSVQTINMTLLWQLLVWSVIFTLCEVVLLTDVIGQVPYVIRLGLMYLVVSASLWLSAGWLSFTASIWLSFAIVTVFYFGLQIGLAIYYHISGTKLNDMLHAYKGN